jgi:hypothetical protein
MALTNRKIAAMNNLWSVICKVYGETGKDVPSELLKWSKEKERLAAKCTGEESFNELRLGGCHQVPIAMIMAIFQPLNLFELKWKRITGTSIQRKRKLRAIEKAATALEEIADIIRMENRNLALADSIDFLPVTGVADLSTTIRTLNTYALILRMFEVPARQTGATTADMLPKYLFSAYVLRTTGSFYDRPVSALIGVALGASYDESAHRMWRRRNYKRIDKELSVYSDMFTEFWLSTHLT